MLPALAGLLFSCLSEPAYEGRLCSPEEPCPAAFVCKVDRCRRACVGAADCAPGQRCEDGACLDEAPPDAGAPDAGLGPTRCAPCDRATVECVDGDSTYRTYVNLGACPEDPTLCSFSTFEVVCAGCAASCEQPCLARVCDDLQGGCRQAGYCVPEPGGASVACAYIPAADSSTCAAAGDVEGLCNSGVCTTCTPGEPCDDQNACTENDSCRDGICAGDPISCDDENPCTSDTCDPTSGCAWANIAGSCDDEMPCTYDDQCSDGSCAGTPITCDDDECMERACNGTSACTERPVSMGEPCTGDGDPCTRDACDGLGACAHSVEPDGTQCGAASKDRCCGGACVDISTNAQHCGGCGTACDPSFSCEPIESTPSCGAMFPPRTSGRCLCNNDNAHCPSGRGQVCRLTQYLDGNRCVPDSTTAMPCAPGQSIQNSNMCPAYCTY